MTAATPGAHFGQAPTPYGAPNMAPYAQQMSQNGGFGRGTHSPASYMGAPQVQPGTYGGNAYGGYQG